ncbi:hypothetical protein LCGC14_2617630 [marine sediment metagenome]|uniref:YprB ribonuclease H-like domain-containing protein n=1 Tax=marine sediment metagenome TaxID=412755 RepID=A0A0F9CF44_9ZZZZ|nr:hypothetical protein [archaeon]
MDFFKFESFDITPLIDQYKGKNFDDLFQNYRVTKNIMGEFIEFIWEDEMSLKFNLLKTKKNLLRNLKVVNYIGDYTENKLNQRGINTLKDLIFNLNFSAPAHRILTLIENKDYRALKINKFVNDLDLTFCFNVEDFLFLDIETLGIIDSPIIIIGIGFFKNARFEIHLFFANKLEDEIAICEHLKTTILPHFKCFITYNGKTFDIPYLANRFLYFFDENPMITGHDQPYEKSNTKFHHIDLYHHCRRLYKGLYDNYSLTNMEAQLLNWKRKSSLPSNLVGICYRKYKKNPERYTGLMKEVIEHNYYDIYSMPLIFKKLLKNL